MPVISPIIPNVIRSSHRASAFLFSIFKARLYRGGSKVPSAFSTYKKEAVLGVPSALKIEWLSISTLFPFLRIEYSFLHKLSSFVLSNGLNNTFITSTSIYSQKLRFFPVEFKNISKVLGKPALNISVWGTPPFSNARITKG